MKHWQVLLLFLVFWSVAASASSGGAPPEVIQAVEQIKKADYEGDRTALKQLNEQLAPYADNEDFGSRVRYWRGFALWRRAINGFNDPVDPKELEQDILQAIDEFQKAVEQDPGFVEAKIGRLSCIGYLGYIHRENKERLEEILVPASESRKEITVEAPDNPRFIWVFGPWVWRTPVERGGGQDKAIATYEKGLELIRNSKNIKNDPLEPSWGEPELLMNLAWSYLNRTQPDLEAAEKNARAALALVPYWHYVRDILLPQILEAKAKAQAGPSDVPIQKEKGGIIDN